MAARTVRRPQPSVDVETASREARVGHPVADHADDRGHALNAVDCGLGVGDDGQAAYLAARKLFGCWHMQRRCQGAEENERGERFSRHRRASCGWIALELVPR